MRALITGITGFVGSYLEKELTGRGMEVFGTSKKYNKKNIYQVDLLDKERIIHVLKETKPRYIFHLAGISNVRESWTNISKTMEVNTVGTANLLEAVKKVDQEIRVITIGSSEEYGRLMVEGVKISEETPLNAVSPYGASKAAVSMLVKQFHQAYGMDIIHLRPFNHIGPGQRPGFVTTDFANQIACINKCKEQNRKMSVGNLEVVRDFTDVRDIVRAYYYIALYGKSGEIYNVSSGRGVMIKEILEILLAFSSKKIEVITDLEKMRPSDCPYFVGDPTKLKLITKWEPTFTMENSLLDIYNYCSR